MPYVPVIGLVGGVGSGKSSLARAAASELPDASKVSPLRIAIVRGDETGHAALAIPHVRERIRQRFGDSVLNSQNEIDRPSVARLVFGSTPEATAARHDLEAIVHPEISRLAKEQIEGIRTRGEADAILLDAAVLLESGWKPMCDAVVFVETPFEKRLRHVQKGRGWDEAELRRREASQWPLEEKRRQAQFVVDNSGDLKTGGTQLAQAIRQIIVRSQAHP